MTISCRVCELMRPTPWWHTCGGWLKCQCHYQSQRFLVAQKKNKLCSNLIFTPKPWFRTFFWSCSAGIFISRVMKCMFFPRIFDTTTRKVRRSLRAEKKSLRQTCTWWLPCWLVMTLIRRKRSWNRRQRAGLLKVRESRWSTSKVWKVAAAWGSYHALKNKSTTLGGHTWLRAPQLRKLVQRRVAASRGARAGSLGVPWMGVKGADIHEASRREDWFLVFLSGGFGNNTRGQECCG